jgi:hypothetical protein
MRVPRFPLFYRDPQSDTPKSSCDMQASHSNLVLACLLELEGLSDNQWKASGKPVM